MTRYKIIVNPISGRGAGERAIAPLQALLQSHGLDFQLVQTERPWHAAELAQQAVADGLDVVVAVGGDGTADEVLNGLVLAKAATGRTAALAVIGAGRGNDFSFGAGMPAGLEASCRVLAEDYRRPMDVGHVVGGDYPQGRYFGNGVGIGFDAVVGFEAAKLTWLSGLPCYVVAALRTIFLYFKAPLVRIEYDGQTLKLKALMVSVMNGRRMGSTFMMAPQAENDDGLFSLCIAQEVSRTRILGLIPYFMKGTQATQKEITTAKAARVVVTALEGSLPAHGDGETLCTQGQQLAMEVLPRHIEIVTQRPGSQA